MMADLLYTIAPESHARDGSRDEEAHIIEKEAVCPVANSIGMDMGKYVDDHKAPIGKEERCIDKYHGVFEAGMFHFLHVLDEAGDTTGEDEQQAGSDDQGAGGEIIAFPANEYCFSRNKPEDQQQHVAALPAGTGQAKNQEYQGRLRQVITKGKFFLPAAAGTNPHFG